LNSISTVSNRLIALRQNEDSDSDNDEYEDTKDIEKLLKQSHKTINTCVSKCNRLKNDFNYFEEIDENQYRSYKNKLRLIMNELDSIEVHGNKALRKARKQAVTFVQKMEKDLYDLQCKPANVLKETEIEEDNQIEVDEAEVKKTCLRDLISNDQELNYLADHVLKPDSALQQNETSHVLENYFSHVQHADHKIQNLPKTPKHNHCDGLTHMVIIVSFNI
jgi:hypothetical protein